MSKSAKMKHGSELEQLQRLLLTLLKWKKLQLLRELGEVENRTRRLKDEIELKGIQVPWLANR
jgi:hypothetical protein